jgi:hypothetical protein
MQTCQTIKLLLCLATSPDEEDSFHPSEEEEMHVYLASDYERVRKKNQMIETSTPQTGVQFFPDIPSQYMKTNVLLSASCRYR